MVWNDLVDMLDVIPFRTLVKFTVLAIGLLLIIGYVFFQARFLIIGPQITLSDIPALVHNERQIFLSGTAFNISRLWLNNRPIYTDVDGNFKEALVLENGYTIATLRAEDRYGRMTTVAQKFVYVPASFVTNI
jgi:hypothetical protein